MRPNAQVQRLLLDNTAPLHYDHLSFHIEVTMCVAHPVESEAVRLPSYIPSLWQREGAELAAVLYAVVGIRICRE